MCGPIKGIGIGVVLGCSWLFRKSVSQSSMVVLWRVTLIAACSLSGKPRPDLQKKWVTYVYLWPLLVRQLHHVASLKLGCDTPTQEPWAHWERGPDSQRFFENLSLQAHLTQRLELTGGNFGEANWGNAHEKMTSKGNWWSRVFWSNKST